MLMGSSPENISEIIGDPSTNSLDSGKGYWQPFQKIVAGVSERLGRYCRPSDEFLREYWQLLKLTSQRVAKYSLIMRQRILRILNNLCSY